MRETIAAKAVIMDDGEDWEERTNGRNGKAEISKLTDRKCFPTPAHV